MHSEFSSILFHNYNFPKAKWAALNPKSFKYVGRGPDMLEEKNLYGQNDLLLRQGFLVKYSQASMEEDFNMIVRWLFIKPKELEIVANKYPIIKAKRDLVIKFYESIDARLAF